MSGDIIIDAVPYDQPAQAYYAAPPQAVEPRA
jgi:hypothetical protein